MQCECGHVQQRYVMSGLFKDYKYQTPQTVATYLEPVVEKLARDYPGARVLEIGCNNGVFLDLLNKAGFDAVGIDPATDHPKAVRAYFTEASAGRFDPVDLVVANNVLAHIDDLQNTFRGILRVLKPDGVLVFEVQYLVDLVKAGAFDLIYGEHLSYHTLKPLQPFLRSFGLVMTGCEHIPAHGGSIRVTAQRWHLGPEYIGLYEGECGIPDEPLDWDGMRAKIEAARKKLKAQGRMVIFGAAAKVSTLMSELGIADQIDYCVDDTPQKILRYIPGTNIQIFPVSKLRNEKVLMGAWNYETTIRERLPSHELIHPFK